MSERDRLVRAVRHVAEHVANVLAIRYQDESCTDATLSLACLKYNALGTGLQKIIFNN